MYGENGAYMIERKRIFLFVIIGIVYLTGCGKGSAAEPMENNVISDGEMAESGKAEAEEVEEETETVSLPDESRSAVREEEEREEFENEAADMPAEVPQLPDTGEGPEDFVPEGWELLDCVELDFNEDGIPDYAGVLESAAVDAEGALEYQGYPRILFAIASDGAGRYRLDFQDSNLIYTGEEGGVMGDPYVPLTAEGTSFTTHTYGGSQWRWSKDFTYTYREDTWWLTSSEETYGYLDYTTDYSKNDWETGVGIRKKRSSDRGDMEESVESAEYDVEYEMALDEPLTLELSGKRGPLAASRVTDWEVEGIESAADVDFSEDEVERPDEAYLNYCDEECVLYVSNPAPNGDEGFHYLVMYRWQDKVMSVLAKEKAAIYNPKFYKGKIYYAAKIVENVGRGTAEEGREQSADGEGTVGIRLNRMNPDGTGKETVFEYRYRESGQEMGESAVSYIGMLYEISGDEIVAVISTGVGHPDLLYRMKTDGSGCEKIGQMPKE